MGELAARICRLCSMARLLPRGDHGAGSCGGAGTHLMHEAVQSAPGRCCMRRLHFRRCRPGCMEILGAGRRRLLARRRLELDGFWLQVQISPPTLR